MEGKQSSTMPKGIDWEAMTIEYASTKTTYREMAKKLGINLKNLHDAAQRYDWQKKRKEHRKKVYNKAVNKAANREASVLAKEFEIADAISNVLKQALKDAQQFNRHLVFVKGEATMDTEERIFDKVDMDALNKAAKTLETVEKIKRSIGGILTIKEKHTIDIDKQRLEIEKGKAKNLNDLDDDDTGVVLLPSIDE